MGQNYIGMFSSCTLSFYLRDRQQVVDNLHLGIMYDFRGYVSEKISVDSPLESSAKHTPRMKCQMLFSLKNNNDNEMEYRLLCLAL